MKFSLLFSDIANADFGDIGKKTLYHLSLDRSFKTIYAGKTGCQYFLEVLSKPLIQEKDILYRQEIISDFLRSPALFEDLKRSLAEFERLREDFKNLKKEIHARNFGVGSALGGSKESVRDCLHLLKKVLKYIEDISAVLDKHPISSQGLLSISHYASSLTRQEDMRHLIGFLDEAEHLCAQSDIGTTIRLDKNGKITGCHLFSPNISSVSFAKERKRLLMKKEAAVTVPYERLPLPPYSDCQTKRKAYPYLEMENLLTSLIAGLLDTFGDLHKEIMFYSVTVEYVRVLERKHISIVFPNVGESTRFVGMTDLYLAMTKEADVIVTNDFYMSRDKKGSIVFGDNGNGKTVFLRAISTCQILAQAGMPIPAQSGVVALFHTMKTQFSESEDEDISNEKMGRFEQEVSELSRLIDTVRSGSLLILNEIFQTTAYSEGAIGLYHILNYLSEKNIGWILVSHLTDLNQYFAGQDVSMYEITKEHKVTQIQ